MLLGEPKRQVSFSIPLKIRLPALGGQFEQVSCDDLAGHGAAVSFEMMVRVFSEDYLNCFFPFLFAPLRNAVTNVSWFGSACSDVCFFLY